MAQWRLRDPGSFPVEFHNAIRLGQGTDKVVCCRITKDSISADRVQWHIFCFSLRHHILHPTAIEYARWIHRTRVAWNGERQVWELLLTSRPPVYEGMQILP